MWCSFRDGKAKSRRSHIRAWGGVGFILCPKQKAGLPEASMAQQQLDAAMVLSTTSAPPFAPKALKEHGQKQSLPPNSPTSPHFRRQPRPVSQQQPAGLQCLCASLLPTSSPDPRARGTLVMMPPGPLPSCGLGSVIDKSTLGSTGVCQSTPVLF